MMQDPVKQGFQTDDTAKSLELNGLGKRPLNFPEKIQEIKLVIVQHDLWKIKDDDDLFQALRDKGVKEIPWMAMIEAQESVQKKEAKKIKSQKNKADYKKRMDELKK